MAEKLEFPHHMIREIFEQPRGLHDTIAPRISLPDGVVQLNEVPISREELRKLSRINIVASGTSRHAGMVGQYAHGNEPCHHMAYLYSYAGVPHKTQARVRSLLEMEYDDQPDGLAGNEDCGQMSAWYVFTAMGFYPLNPASGEYMIGSPMYSRMSIRLSCRIASCSAPRRAP